MEIIAKSKYIRISPRKMRLVVDAIRGLSVNEAMLMLENLPQRSTEPILAVFKQAIGNAKNNFNLVEEDLKIKEIQIGKGPTIKRWRAVSRGRARTIFKRTSHIILVLKSEKQAETKMLPKTKIDLNKEVRKTKEKVKPKQKEKNGTKS